MYFLLIQLLLIILYRKAFVTSTYNNVCATTCSFPGMICVHGQCKCDWKIRLFWTGARCLLCPSIWSMSEIACIGFYGTPMSWVNAVATCQSMQGDLISLRDNSILPLMYQVTGGNTPRKKRTPALVDKTIGWTSAHAIQLINLGLYQWNDKSLKNFDSTNTWWCKIGIVYLGYFHSRNEPTRLTYNNDVEKCVLFRRGKTAIPMLCLDDVFCNQLYPFVCERTEYTARLFFGSSPSNMGTDDNNVDSKTSTSTSAGNGDNTEKDKDPTTSTEHHLEMLAKPNTSKSNKNTKSIIMILGIGLLLLAAIITGVFCFMKHRNTTETQFHAGNNVKKDQTSSSIRSSVTSDTNDEDELSSHRMSIGQDDLISPVDIDNQKQQKNKRGGYSKQKFDEFE